VSIRQALRYLSALMSAAIADISIATAVISFAKAFSSFSFFSIPLFTLLIGKFPLMLL